PAILTTVNTLKMRLHRWAELLPLTRDVLPVFWTVGSARFDTIRLWARGFRAMPKKSKFTEEQIAFALRQAEAGLPVDDICRKLGISQATFFRWKQRYGGMGTAELRRLRLLEEENKKL